MTDMAQVDSTQVEDTAAYYTTLVEQSKLHDEKLLWVVGGVVAVSITFLAGLLPRVTVVRMPGLLFWSWLSLGLSVVITFVNLQVSNWGFQVRIKSAGSPATVDSAERDGDDALVLAVNILNALSVLLLAIGLLLLALFAWANLAVAFPIPA